MPRVVAIKNAAKGENHVIGIKIAGRFEPGGGLERHVVAQMEAVGCAVVQHLPAFSQFGDQTIGIRIDIKQAVVELGGEGIDDQAAADFLWVKGVDLTADAIHKAAIANVGVRRQRGRGKSLPAQHRYRCQERRQFQAHSFFLIIEQGSILLILNNIYHHLIAYGDNISDGCVGYLTNGFKFIPLINFEYTS